MEVFFWLLVILALSSIGKTWVMRETGKNLVAAKLTLEELKLAKKMEIEERRLAAVEGRVAKLELKKQIKLVEALLPLKQFDRETLKKMPVQVRQAIYGQLGLDELVVESYLRMSDAEIERIKVGL